MERIENGSLRPKTSAVATAGSWCEPYFRQLVRSTIIPIVSRIVAARDDDRPAERVRQRSTTGEPSRVSG
ncbi:MAG TPA: hypothetical protein VLY83_03955 [Methanoregula sp.]|nr:hypothetical protein [Methanoregula sp.]